MYLPNAHHSVVSHFKASIKMSGSFFFFFSAERWKSRGGTRLMKSRAYRPSHDRIIIPNASSEHFKGHFIPVPTPHNASQQSRWPDPNQVPPPPGWSAVSRTLGSAGHPRSKQHPIYARVTGARGFKPSWHGRASVRRARARGGVSHIDSEESKQRSADPNTRAAVTLCPFLGFLFFLFFFLIIRPLGCVL